MKNYLKLVIGAVALLASTASHALIYKTTFGFERGSGYSFTSGNLLGFNRLKGGTGFWNSVTGDFSVSGVTYGSNPATPLQLIKGNLKVVGNALEGDLVIPEDGVSIHFRPEIFGSYANNYRPNSFDFATGIMSLWGSNTGGFMNNAENRETYPNFDWSKYAAFDGKLTFVAVPVPEPSVLALFGAGLLGLVVARRRRV